MTVNSTAATTTYNQDYPELNLANASKKRGGRRQTNSAEHSTPVDIHTHNQMRKTFADKLKHQDDELKELRAQLAEKNARVQVLNRNLSIMTGPGSESVSEEASQLPKSVEGLTGITRIYMNALLERAEPTIRDVKELLEDVQSIKGSLEGVKANAKGVVQSASKSDTVLMSDLGISGVKVVEDGKETLKVAAIESGLLEKFNRICESYHKLVAEANKCIHDLQDVKAKGNLVTLDPTTVDMVARVMLFNPQEWDLATKHHLEMYNKLCEMENTLRIDKEAIDDELVIARKAGNYVVHGHYMGIGMTTKPSSKLFKFEPVIHGSETVDNS